MPQENMPRTLPRDETTASRSSWKARSRNGPKVLSRSCTPETLFFYVFPLLWVTLRRPYIVCQSQDLAAKSAHTLGGMIGQEGV